MVTVSNISGDYRAMVGVDYCGRAVSTLLGPLTPSPIWQRCRIAIRFCYFLYTGNVNNPLRIGLCHGPSFYGQGGSNPSHAAMFEFLGDYLSGNTYAWLYYPTPVHRYHRKDTYGELWVGGSKVGSASGAIESSYHEVGADDALRTLLFCDFTRTTPGPSEVLTMNCYYNASTSIVDVSKAEFDAQSILLNPTQPDHVWGVGATMACDEVANGVFDHINISNEYFTTAKISDVSVVVLSTM